MPALIIAKDGIKLKAGGAQGIYNFSPVQNHELSYFMVRI